MKIEIEIEDTKKEYFNVGYSFHDKDENIIHFEELPRKEQLRILNAFAKGYSFWVKFLKEDEE